MTLQQTTFENIMTKEEIAQKRAISTFATMFFNSVKYTYIHLREISNFGLDVFKGISATLN